MHLLCDHPDRIDTIDPHLAMLIGNHKAFAISNWCEATGNWQARRPAVQHDYLVKFLRIDLRLRLINLIRADQNV